MIKLLQKYLPFFNSLSELQQNTLASSAYRAECKEGKNLRSKNEECLGLVIVTIGRLRVYITSDEGKEITLYRLPQGDISLLAASCAMPNIHFDILLEAEVDSEVIIISPSVFRQITDASLPASNYINLLLSARLSRVMCLMDQVLNQRLDSRLAALLLEEAALRQSDVISITQEQLANHLGTAREVVTRTLKTFRSKGWIKAERQSIKILSAKDLQSIST